VTFCRDRRELEQDVRNADELIFTHGAQSRYGRIFQAARADVKVKLEIHKIGCPLCRLIDIELASQPPAEILRSQ
jgi:hypothetical protein